MRCEAILEKAQNNWEFQDGMEKFGNKFFEKCISEQELKDSITFNSPVPVNLPKAKSMDDYFVELFQDQKKITLNDTFKQLQTPQQNVVHSGEVTSRGFQEI